MLIEKNDFTNQLAVLRVVLMAANDLLLNAVCEVFGPLMDNMAAAPLTVLTEPLGQCSS